MESPWKYITTLRLFYNKVSIIDVIIRLINLLEEQSMKN
jgi:hypothetical protein